METLKGRLPFTDKNPLFKKLEKLAEYANLHKDDKWAYWQAQDQIACAEDIIEQNRKEASEEARKDERAKAHEETLSSAYDIFMSGSMQLEQIAKFLKLDLNELSDYIIKRQKADNQDNAQ